MTTGVPSSALQSIMQMVLGQQQTPGQSQNSGSINLSQPGATPSFIAANAPSQNSTADVERQALDRAVSKTPEQKKTLSDLDKIAGQLGDMSTQPNPVQKYETAIANIAQTPEWQKHQADINDLQEQFSKPMDTIAETRKRLGDRNDYINNRIQQSYTSHGKLGAAMQFLQDMLRKPGTPNGQQAVYKMASDEYDKAAQDVKEQLQSERQSQLLGIAAGRQQQAALTQQMQSQLDAARVNQQQQALNMRSLDNAANIVLKGGSLSDKENVDTVNSAVKAWSSFEGLTDAQQMRQLVQANMDRGMDRESAIVRAQAIMMSMKSLAKGPMVVGQSNTQTIDPNTLATTTTTNKTLASPAQYNPILQQILKQAQTQSPATPTPSALPTQLAQPQTPAIPQTPLLRNIVQGAQGQQGAQGAPAQNVQANSLGMQLGNLQSDPSRLSMRSGAGAMMTKVLLDQAQKVWDARPWDENEMGRAKPQWSTGLYKQVQDAEKDYGTGARSKQVDAFNTAVRHVDLLTQAAQALVDGEKTGNYQIFNRLSQMYSTQTGDPAFTNANTLADRLGKEINKVYINGGGGSGERKDIERQFSPVQSPQQLMGVISQNVGLLSGAMKTLQTRYKQDTLGTGTKQLVNADVQQIINNLSKSSQSKVDLSKFWK